MPNPDYLTKSNCRIYESPTRESNHSSSQRGDSAHPLQISVATEPFSRVQSCFLYERDLKKLDCKVNWPFHMEHATKNKHLWVTSRAVSEHHRYVNNLTKFVSHPVL